tara:strand:+ start:1612 stop:2319 length:708 start_codon:yes stop_codon:yes gene_type:complete
MVIGRRLFEGIMSDTVWFLTSNPGKLAEASVHFASLGIEVKGLEVPDGAIVEPQASDLESVARAKIEQALDHLPHDNAMLLVEDAGLFVTALDGFPGVYSSYAYNTIGNQGVIRLLEHLQSEDPVRAKRLRAASFKAVSILWKNGVMLVGKGECQGSIASQIQGAEGFGFDPIFIPYDLDEHGQALDPENLGSLSTHGQTFGEVGVEVKHRFSHRKRALDDLMDQWQNQRSEDGP